MVKEYTALRLEPELKQALKQAAKDDSRTLASLVSRILSDWVAANVAPKPVRKRAVAGKGK